MRSLRIFSAAALALAVITFLPACSGKPESESKPAPVPAPAPAVALRPCAWSTPQNIALCGEHQVWEDRAAAAGRKITLRIVVFPARSDLRQRDPLYFLEGGPSVAAADKAKDFPADALPRLRATRDLVFVNQRGTGEGSSLACDLTGGLAGDRPFTGDLFPEKTIKNCAAKWNADARFYTTALAAQDMEEVRVALGYPQLNLSAISYGTVLAQEYARRYPQRVRTMTLDGVAELDMLFPLSFPRSAQLALDGFFADCAADAACNKAYPHLPQQFAEVLAKLAKRPANVNYVAEPASKPQRLRVSRELFTTTMRSMLYSTESQKRIPQLIDQASRGQFNDFLREAIPIRRFHFDGLGMYLALVCNEDVAFTTPQQAAEMAASTFLGTYWYDQIAAACRHIPRGAIPEDFHAPLKSAVPTLLLSGGSDPTTPAAGAERVAQNLSNSLHVVIPNRGHIFRDEDYSCADRVQEDFIFAGTPKDLDTRCLQQIRRPPFAIQ